jgi:Holliday junction resolvase
MSGRRSRDKGARTERAIVKALQAQGFMATKISGMYKPGADISMPFLGSDRAVEVTQAQTTAVLTYRKQRKPALGPVGDSRDDWGTS